MLNSSIRKPAEISAHLQMGVTRLNVKSLSVMTEFYVQQVGLHPIATATDSITLGYGKRPILRLLATPELSHLPAGSAGLYHNAILFDTQAALATTVERILRHQPTAFTGAADHLVSEAFYFTDPEGNGLELYVDRDPKRWQWRGGKILMATNYLDPVTFITAHGRNRTASPEMKMGHVHLKIGDIATARQFYVKTLGMIIVAEFPSALFISDGLYHHNIGLNTWESAGAKARTPSLGLQSLTVLVEDQTDLEKLADRLTTAAIEHEQTNNKLTVNDPWGNIIHFEVTAST